MLIPTGEDKRDDWDPKMHFLYRHDDWSDGIGLHVLSSDVIKAFVELWSLYNILNGRWDDTIYTFIDINYLVLNLSGLAYNRHVHWAPGLAFKKILFSIMLSSAMRC